VRSWLKPRAIVGHLEQQPARLFPDPHPSRGLGPCVFGRILQGLEAAEVNGGLDLGRMPADTIGFHISRKRRTPAGGTHGLTKAGA
jgi:hypothetical protein